MNDKEIKLIRQKDSDTIQKTIQKDSDTIQKTIQKDSVWLLVCFKNVNRQPMAGDLLYALPITRFFVVFGALLTCCGLVLEE